MRLTSEQVRQYRDQGYVVVEQFFDDREVAAMRAELERFKAEGLIRNVAVDGDGKTTSTRVANLQIIPLNDKSDLFRAFPFAGKVRDAVSALIGDAWVRYLDQIFLKPGHHGAGTSWHQDNAYFKIGDPRQGVGMWTALHDASVANGTLHVVPRSDRQAIEHTRDLGSDHHIRCEVDEREAVPVIVPAGGVIFFNWGIAHCTRGNTTDHERAGLAYHFLTEDAVPTGRWEEARPPVRVTGPAADDGQTAYGSEQTGAWERLVDRLASRGNAATA